MCTNKTSYIPKLIEYEKIKTNSYDNTIKIIEPYF